MSKLKTGSVVMLKSGGPRMAVFSVTGHLVKTQWFEGFSLREDTFHIDSLNIL